MLGAAALGFFVGPILAHGAQIYLDPATGKYPPGVTFGVDVRIDNQGECINAAEVNLSYPKDQLEAVAASDGDSIFSLWVKSPTIYSDYGLVSFVGGLPGGYCGRVAGDSALSNKLATIYFRFPTSTALASSSIPQPAQLTFLSGTKALVNDGAGTLASLTTGGATYTRLLKGKYVSLDTWQKAIENDTTSPDPFIVGIYRNSSLFDNNWFAVFSTVDKQTGIDHYEVAEVSSQNSSVPQSQWNWFRAVSPYLIKDQKLTSLIAVRAIDRAGNIRVEHYLPVQSPQREKQIAIIPFIAIIGIVGFGLIKLILSLL